VDTTDNHKQFFFFSKHGVNFLGMFRDSVSQAD